MRLLLISALLLAGCSSAPVVHTVPPAHPTVDCRPYPQPTRIAIDDVRPIALTDGWKLTHDDFLTVAKLNKQFIAYQEQTREVAKYFVRCIEDFNTKVERMNDAKAPPEPEPEGKWWNPWD